MKLSLKQLAKTNNYSETKFMKIGLVVFEFTEILKNLRISVQIDEQFVLDSTRIYLHTFKVNRLDR